MTHDEIQQLDAGALRLAVAEALGIKYRVSDGMMDFICGDRLHREYAEKGDLIGMVTCAYDETIQHEDLLSDWPRDLTDAWLLVEEIGKEVFLHHKQDCWACGLFIDGFGEVFYATGDTAPIAICRGWLMWKAQLR